MLVVWVWFGGVWWRGVRVVGDYCDGGVIGGCGDDVGGGSDVYGGNYCGGDSFNDSVVVVLVVVVMVVVFLMIVVVVMFVVLSPVLPAVVVTGSDNGSLPWLTTQYWSPGRILPDTE